MDTPTAMSLSNIVDRGVENATNTATVTYKKKFNFNIKSTKCSTTWQETTLGKRIKCFTYVHSLPWQFAWFYMTKKEFRDLQTTNHTARVKHVNLKIINLGNRTPFITGQNTVSYANANSQTTIGIWENLESIGPVTMGSSISPQTLYGSQLSKITSRFNTRVEVSKNEYGATSQAKNIDNRIAYNFLITAKHDNAELELNDGNFYFPSMLMQSKILYNATNSIGPIYEKSYTPVDGTIHKYNNAWFDTGVVGRRSAPGHDVEANTGYTRETGTTRIHDNNMANYETATIDNIVYCGMNNNPSEHMLHSLGVGIIPLLNEDETIEKAVFNFMVETEIIIETESHGTNALMNDSHYPQPNTHKVGLLAPKRIFINAFGVNGLPLVSAENMRHDQVETENENDVTQESAWSRASGPTVYKNMPPVLIPGQRRITGKMTHDERVLVVNANLKIRKAYIATEKSRGTHITIQNKKNIQYGIPSTGEGERLPANSDDFWKEIDTVGKKS